MTKRGAIYARVSTDEQAKPGLASIPHQIQQCKQRAEQDDFTITDNDIYTDDETGQSLNRPGISHFLLNIEKYSHLYAYDATRIARRRVVALAIREELRQHNVSLVLVHGDTSGMDEEARVFMESIQDASAEAEIIRFKRRTRMGRERRAERGLHAGKVPMGWKSIRNKQGKSIGLVHDPEYDRFFSDLEELFLAGMSYVQITIELEKRGHINDRLRKRHSLPHICYTMKNPVNFGHVIFGWITRDEEDQITNRDALPPRWQDPAGIRRELDRRKSISGSSRKRMHKFTGILKCFYCNWTLVARTEKYRNKSSDRVSFYRRYRCGKHHSFIGHRVEEDCPNIYSLKETDVSEQLLEWSRKFRHQAEIKLFVSRNNSHDLEKQQLEYKQINNRINEINQGMKHLVDRMMDVPEAALTDIRSRMEDLTQERKNLEERSNVLRFEFERLPDPSEYRETVIDIIGRLEDLLNNSPPYQIQTELRKLFPEGIMVRDRTLLLP